MLLALLLLFMVLFPLTAGIFFLKMKIQMLNYVLIL